MKIEYFGHSCFRLTADDGFSVLTDPYTKVGYELPNGLTANLVTTSHQHFDHNYTQAVKSEYVLGNVGEYALGGIQITGIESWHDPLQGKLRGSNVIFKFVIDGITVCHLGDLGEEPSDELVKKIGKVDVLLLPVGGTYTIDALQAKAYMGAIFPKIVIPMRFKPTDGTLDIAPISGFLELFEKSCIETKDGETYLNAESLAKEKILYIRKK
jgi:L-ascorbate metabolism protein UlaG (beta-lactamase superfamily)